MLFRCSKMSGKHKANFVLGFSCNHENDRYKRIRKDLLPCFVLFCVMEQACKWVSNHHPTGQAYRMLFSLFALYLTLQVLFSVFASQIDSCNEKWEKIRQVRAEAGRKGGAKKGNQNAVKQKQTKQANACFAKQKQAKTSKNKQCLFKTTKTSKTSCNCY